MKSSIFVCTVLCLVLIAVPLSAFETDQYNLPPEPLADIGDEFTEYLEENLRQAIEKVNREIAARKLCLETTNRKKSKCDSIGKERERLSFLESGDAVAKEVYELLGTGIPPLTRSGSWLESHRFEHQPARYKAGYSDSIFATAPFDFLTLSSTVRMYDVEFGTDKIAHIFQQGYTYYKSFRKNSSRQENAASKKAIKWGKISERTFYGTLVSGVFSNGDLAANYIGLKFYQGLTQEIIIGDKDRLPVVRLENGVWVFNENSNLKENLFKPFVSKHLNEALNPSIFMKAFGFRAFVRRVVRKHACEQWKTRFPDLTPALLDQTTDELKNWYGEDYGYTASSDFITIANTCF